MATIESKVSTVGIPGSGFKNIESPVTPLDRAKPSPFMNPVGEIYKSIYGGDIIIRTLGAEDRTRAVSFEVPHGIVEIYSISEVIALGGLPVLQREYNAAGMSSDNGRLLDGELERAARSRK